MLRHQLDKTRPRWWRRLLVNCYTKQARYFNSFHGVLNGIFGFSTASIFYSVIVEDHNWSSLMAA
jgi:hypothetical protein